MPSLAIETTVPETHFAFVLRRYDRELVETAIALPTYTRIYDSRWIELDGVKAHTLFVETAEERDFGVRRGWLDETEQFRRAERQAGLDEKAVEAIGAGAKTPSTIAKVCGVQVSDLVDVLDRLEEEGRVVRGGKGAIEIWTLPTPKAPLPEGTGAAPPA